MTIEEKIKKEFNINKELTVKELVFRTHASKQMIHIVLKKLLSQNYIEKLGRVPKTIYRLLDKRNEILIPSLPIISDDTQTFLIKNFLVITETGNLVEGIEAFDYWCKKRNQPTQKTLAEFIKTKQKYSFYYDKGGMVNGTEKLIKTYNKNTYLNEVYYLDFYAIERFGKTRLGTLLHYAKQGQNLFLMNIMMEEIHNRIIEFIMSNHIDAVGFVPPTIRREIQIMKFIQENLKIALPVLEIKKISGIIPVPQKSLSKLDERIINAENTFAVTDQRQFKKVLLIDDAVGSGSTLNQIAEKIKNKKVAKKVIGLAIVGSFKGFDVITDI
jgi:dimeric dUTPase (all-alpha-NTP-PPase superfamily)